MMNSYVTNPDTPLNAPAEWQGQAGVVGPFESRKTAQMFASFRVDFSRLVVRRTFARGNFWYLELSDALKVSGD